MTELIDTRTRKYTASILIIIVGIFLIYSARQYFNAFFLALVFAFLTLPFYKRLAKKIGKSFAAGLTILLTVIIILVPFVLLSILLVNEIPEISGSLNNIKNDFGSSLEIFGSNIDLGGQVSNLLNIVKDYFSSAVTGATFFILTVFIALFVLYFLLVSQDKYRKILYDVLPFNEKNSLRLVVEFENVTKSAIIGSGIIAIVQGALLALGFLIFGIKGALFWGFITVVLSFIPVVGAFLIWLPAGLIMIFFGNYFAGIGIILWGFILISLADNVLRPILSRKIADIHPLITFIGVFIGIPVFGLLGLIIGPLLLSYFFLLIEMYIEEYWGK